MQLSQNQRQSLTNLSILLSEDLFTFNQLIDLNTEAYMNFFYSMSIDGVIDPEKADQINYTQRHITRILRELAILKDSPLFIKTDE